MPAKLWAPMHCTEGLRDPKSPTPLQGLGSTSGLWHKEEVSLWAVAMNKMEGHFI